MYFVRLGSDDSNWVGGRRYIGHAPSAATVPEVEYGASCPMLVPWPSMSTYSSAHRPLLEGLAPSWSRGDAPVTDSPRPIDLDGRVCT